MSPLPEDSSSPDKSSPDKPLPGGRFFPPTGGDPGLVQVDYSALTLRFPGPAGRYIVRVWAYEDFDAAAGRGRPLAKVGAGRVRPASGNRSGCLASGLYRPLGTGRGGVRRGGPTAAGRVHQDIPHHEAERWMMAFIKADDFGDQKEIQEAFARVNYLLPDHAATVVFLAGRLEKPILVEGPAGVGKTDLARMLAQVLGRKLIRLQCYEGLDDGKALYEWQYGKQLLYSQILRDRISDILSGQLRPGRGHGPGLPVRRRVFFRTFPAAAPLVGGHHFGTAGGAAGGPKWTSRDAEFEAFLLEVLSGYTVSIPEIGTIAARTIPRVILTSNNSREMSDALKRRCLHLYLDFPSPDQELKYWASKSRTSIPRRPGRW